MTAMSSAGLGAISCPLGVSSVCCATHVRAMSLATFGLCSIVPSITLICLPGFQTNSLLPSASGDPVVCYSLFLCSLSSAVGFFNKPWHQGEFVVIQQKVVQIWPSLPRGSGTRSPKVPSLIFFNLLLLNICASDVYPLDPTSTQRNR